MKGKFIYANGMNISQSRKLFKFYFGDFFIKADRNEEQLRFDVFIKDKLISEDGKEIKLLNDWCDVEYFKEYWSTEGSDNHMKGPGAFNLIILEEKIKKTQ